MTVLQHPGRGGSLAAVVALVIAAVFWPAAPAAAQKTVLASLDGGAYVSSAGKNLWIIGNDGITLTLGINAHGALALSTIMRPGAERPWTLDPVGDFSVRVGSKTLTPGQGDFVYRFSATSEEGGSVRLSLVFESPSARLRATRTWACFPGAPAIETWTTYETYLTSDPVTLADISLLELNTAGTAVNWITGLHPVEQGLRAFTRQRRSLADGLNLTAPGRSSTAYLPVTWIDGDAGHLVTGLAWSGSWFMSASPAETPARSAIRISLGDTETSVMPGTDFESPHAFFAVAANGDVPTALGAYARIGIRHGRPFSPLVTYNTWFADGVRISESQLPRQIAHASELGAELFVVDAGWYAGSGQGDAFDFTAGLGNWVPDPERFSHGLRPISDEAHAYGLQFGIWMEPERIDLAVLPRTPEPDPDTGEPLPTTGNGLQESWLATSGGVYEPGAEPQISAQICLADPKARQWVLDQVTRVIEESGADYLKWDNNFWINCDREGHGHGPNDGNLAHHLGLYEVLRQLRERFPALSIENCTQGGNRLDLGMMRYTDTAWMDDVTAPSSHVRHNIEGLGAIFPPSYLLSFLTDDPTEPILGAWDLPAYLRSRMPGVLGVSLQSGELGDADRETLVAEVGHYKVLRNTTLDASLLLLTPQQGAPDTDGWEAMQLLSPSSGHSVVYIFANPGSAESTVVRLRGLDPEGTYLVSMADGRVVGEANGALLMADGIGATVRPESSAIVVKVTKLVAPPPDAAIKK